HLFYISGGGRSLSLVRRTARVTAAREEHAPLVGTAYPAFFPEVDSINQLANARRLAWPLRRSRSVWVVTTSAHHGLAATRCGRGGCGTVRRADRSPADPDRSGALLSRARRSLARPARGARRRLRGTLERPAQERRPARGRLPRGSVARSRSATAPRRTPAAAGGLRAPPRRSRGVRRGRRR